jgi:hypothetical protein
VVSVCAALVFDSAHIAAAVVDLTTLFREFITIFGEMYRENSCLWEVESKEYSKQVEKYCLPVFNNQVTRNRSGCKLGTIC